MSPNLKRMTIEEFYAWVERRPDEERWELVDGFPVRMMAGAKRSHRVVVNNIAFALTPAARKRGCDTATNDAGVATRSAHVRLPDVVIDCAPPGDDAMGTGRPVIVVEVLSPSTRFIDQTDKLDEFRALESVRVVILVEPDIVAVKLYRREEGGEWSTEHYRDLSERIALPEIDAALLVSEIYATLSPDERSGPRPV